MRTSSSIKDYVKKVPYDWNRTVKSIFLAADSLADAKEHLISSRFKELCKRIGLTSRVVDRLIDISNDHRIREKGVRNNLPPSWGTIYEITRLGNNKLQKAIAERLINPHVTRREITSLLKGGNQQQKTERFPRTKKLFTIRLDNSSLIDPTYVQEVYDAFRLTYKQLREEREMLSVHCEDHGLMESVIEQSEKAQHRQIEKDRNLARQLAKKVIRTLLAAQRKKLSPTVKRTPSQRKQYECYQEEFLMLYDDERIDSALQGLDVGFSLDDLTYDNNLMSTVAQRYGSKPNK